MPSSSSTHYGHKRNRRGSKRHSPPPIPDRNPERGSHYTGRHRDTDYDRHSGRDRSSSRRDYEVGGGRLDAPFDQPYYDSRRGSESYSHSHSHSRSRSHRDYDEPKLSSRYTPSSRDEPSAYEYEYKSRPFEDSLRSRDRDHTSGYSSRDRDTYSSSSRRPELSVDTSSRRYEYSGPVNRNTEHYDIFGAPHFTDTFNSYERTSPGPFVMRYDHRYNDEPSYSRSSEFETTGEASESRKYFGGY